MSQQRRTAFAHDESVWRTVNTGSNPEGDFPRKRLCHRRRGDSVSELLEAMDVVMREALGCQPVEVIRAEVAVEKDHGLRNLVGSTEPTEPILMHAGDGKVGK